MSNQFSSRFVLACVLAIFSRGVAAQASTIDLLTCNLGKIGSAFTSSLEHLQPSPNGTFVVAGPIQSQGLCVQNAVIAAAFGVFTVTAELCDSTTQPLYDWLAKNRPELQQSTSENQLGIIAVFGTEENFLSVFHGRASIPLRHDPTSQQLSFFCGVTLSGPQ